MCSVSLAYEVIENDWPTALENLTHHFPDALFYAVLGPVVLWLVFTWLMRRVSERDKAIADLIRLRYFTEEIATVSDMASLIDIALCMPEQLLGPVSSNVILRDPVGGPWRLTGTHNLSTSERAALEATLLDESALRQYSEYDTTNAADLHCYPLLSRLNNGHAVRHRSVTYLSLSKDHPRDALLMVYRPSQAALSRADHRALKSMAAGLSVAMDHAQSRERETALLHVMEETTRKPTGLEATLERITANIATLQQADAAVVYLRTHWHEANALVIGAAWPAGADHPEFLPLAQRAIDTLSVVDSRSAEQQRAALPLVVDGVAVGALVLAGQQCSAVSTSLAALLDAATGMMTLAIRNSQLFEQLVGQIILEERSRLAREVHDGLAQSLGYLHVKLQQVERLLARGDTSIAHSALHELHDNVQEIYADVRSTLHDLRWLQNEDEGLVAQLARYVSVFSSRTGLPVAMSTDKEMCVHPLEQAQLFRIVQEALTNVHRHAGAQHASVLLHADTNGIRLEVEDDGVGFGALDVQPQTSDHIGLRVIRERALTIGGSLSVESVPRAGTTLRVVVPATRRGVINAQQH
jgi:signal transduction histidine kinase